MRAKQVADVELEEPALNRRWQDLRVVARELKRLRLRPLQLCESILNNRFIGNEADESFLLFLFRQRSILPRGAKFTEDGNVHFLQVTQAFLLGRRKELFSKNVFQFVQCCCFQFTRLCIRQVGTNGIINSYGFVLMRVCPQPPIAAWCPRPSPKCEFWRISNELPVEKSINPFGTATTLPMSVVLLRTAGGMARVDRKHGVASHSLSRLYVRSLYERRLYKLPECACN